MSEFLTNNRWPWQLVRTIAQGVLGVVVANVNMLVGWAVFELTWRAVVVALVITMLTPVTAALGAGHEIDSVPIQRNLSAQAQHLAHFSCPGTEALRDKKLPDLRRARSRQTRER